MKSEMEDQGLGVDAGVTGPGSSVVVRVPYIIDLPHEGFNPSITRWRGRLLMAWRKGWFSARLWLGELSEDHRLLWGREIDFSRIWRLTDEDWLEDPRLIVAGGKVLVAFTFVRHGNIFMACDAGRRAGGGGLPDLRYRAPAVGEELAVLRA